MSDSRKIWECKIGFANNEELPEDADLLMRQAIKKAFQEITGREADFSFCGWGGTLDAFEEIEVEEMQRDSTIPPHSIG